MSEGQLVAMLRERPKNVPLLRTRADFQRFFRGMSRRRLRRLLQDAYADLPEQPRAAKVKKRLLLLGPVDDEEEGEEGGRDPTNEDTP